jgi:hypothetical protein
LFLIASAGRSGTTLLASCLDRHPEIAVPRETNVIGLIYRILARVPDAVPGRDVVSRLIVSSDLFSQHLGSALTPEDVREAVHAAEYTVPAIVQAVFGRYALKRGKRIAGDKSPNEFSDIPRMLSILMDGDFRVVHLVRDVRDVVVSLSKTAFGPPSFQKMVETWSRENLKLNEKALAYREQYLMVRYEDLVRSPGEELSRIAAFLGAGFHPAMLAHEGRGGSLSEMPGHQLLGRPITDSRVGAWKREIDPEIAQSIERTAGEALRFFGYEVTEEPASSSDPAGQEEFKVLLAHERRGGERVRRQYREACVEINRLQKALDEQARWNTDIAKGIPERDAEIRRLQGVLEEPSRWNVNLHRGVSKWAVWGFFNRKTGGRPS